MLRIKILWFGFRKEKVCVYVCDDRQVFTKPCQYYPLCCVINRMLKERSNSNYDWAINNLFIIRSIVTLIIILLK